MIVVTQAGVVVAPEDVTPAQVEASYTVLLTGTDGTVWNLNTGPVTLKVGTKLFHRPQVTHWTKTSAAVPGSRWTGSHDDEQSYTLPVRVIGADWEDYRTTDKAFFNGLDPAGEVTITVIAPDGVTRAISCRFVTEGDQADDFDPLMMSNRAYSLGFIAPDPFWRGTPVTRRFNVTAPVAFLDPPGPPIYINPPTASDSAQISNLGDVPTWPRYTITAPFTAFSVGVGDSLVSSSQSYADGRVVTIDSSPRQRTIVDEAGLRVYRDMDEVSFQPVPPGVDVPVVLTVDGFTAATVVDVDLTPLYWRPM